MNLKSSTITAFVFTLLDLLINLYRFVTIVIDNGRSFGSSLGTVNFCSKILAEAALCLFLYILYRKQSEAKGNK
jgi:hypothetical protein